MLRFSGNKPPFKPDIPAFRIDHTRKSGMPIDWEIKARQYVAQDKAYLPMPTKPLVEAVKLGLSEKLFLKAWHYVNETRKTHTNP